MVFDRKDLLQNAIGAFSAVIFVYVLRDTPLSIDPQNGLILGSVWLALIYNPFTRQTRESRLHFIWSIIISVAINVYLAVTFGLFNLDVLFTFDFFGSIAWLTTLISVPVAVLFDKKNVNNPILRYFIRRK